MHNTGHHGAGGQPVGFRHRLWGWNPAQVTATVEGLATRADGTARRLEASEADNSGLRRRLAEVESELTRVRSALDDCNRRRSELSREVTGLRERDEFAVIGDRVASLFDTARHAGTSLLEKAEHQAGEVLAESRRRAELMISQASSQLQDAEDRLAGAQRDKAVAEDARRRAEQMLLEVNAEVERRRREALAGGGPAAKG